MSTSSSFKSDKTWVGGLSVNDDVGDSGLYLMGHRHYDPSLGRFLSRDPIGFDGGLNLYSYADNNQSTLVDPFGLKSWQQELYELAIAASGAVKSPFAPPGPSPLERFLGLDPPTEEAMAKARALTLMASVTSPLGKRLQGSSKSRPVEFGPCDFPNLNLTALSVLEGKLYLSGKTLVMELDMIISGGAPSGLTRALFGELKPVAKELGATSIEKVSILATAESKAANAALLREAGFTMFTRARKTVVKWIFPK